MHLSVLADDPTRAVDQDRCVEPPWPPAVSAKLGVTEIEADSPIRGRLEQRLRLGPRHPGLAKGIDLPLIGHVEAGEEGGERQLGKNHELAPE